LACKSVPVTRRAKDLRRSQTAVALISKICHWPGSKVPPLAPLEDIFGLGLNQGRLDAASKVATASLSSASGETSSAMSPPQEHLALALSNVEDMREGVMAEMMAAAYIGYIIKNGSRDLNLGS
jgi:hypothetical protein